MNKWVSFLLFFCLLISVSVPPISEAQTAMDRGLAAAKQKEWELAIKYFSEAQKAAPTSPKALFNLALAYDSAGGRELITIAWYRAYLAALPNAANAKQVEKRIIELEIKVEATIGKLIRKAMTATARLPDESSKIEAYTAIAEAQTKAGDIAGAKETAARITNDSDKSWAYREIASAQAKAGDIAGAKETAARITSDYYKSWAYRNIAKAQTKAGDKAGSRNSLTKAKESAARITSGFFKPLAYRDIARAQAKAGDIAGAKETAARIINDVYKSKAYRYIAAAQAKAGDKTGTKRTSVAAIAQTKPIDLWLEFIVIEEELKAPLFVDLQGHIQSLTAKKPLDMVRSLAEAAGKMADALFELKSKSPQ